MKRDDLTVGEISRRLAKQAERVCAELLPRGAACRGKWIEASTRAGGLGDSLMVELDGAKAGRWHHYGNPNDPRAHGDLIDLAAYLRGYDKGQAVAWAKSFLGLVESEAPAANDAKAAKAQAKREESREEKRARALRIWRAARPIAGTPAETYLESRGHAAAIFGGRWPASLGFLPALRHPFARRAFPVLLGAVQRPDGEVGGIWRIYLAADGRDKAPVEAPRLGLGETWGGAVRLAPNPLRLVLAEGLETAMGLARRQPGWGVWATLHAGNLVGCVLPATVAELLIGADHDRAHRHPGSDRTFRPGQDAARRAMAKHARIWLGEGEARRRRRVAVVMPGLEGADFDDLGRPERLAALAAATRPPAVQPEEAGEWLS